MSNHFITTPVLNKFGMQLNTLDAQFMVLNAFRYTLYNRDVIDRRQIINFLCDRVSEIDLVTKGQIAREISTEINNDSLFSNDDLEAWMIVLRVLTQSLVNSY